MSLIGFMRYIAQKLGYANEIVQAAVSCGNRGGEAGFQGQVILGCAAAMLEDFAVVDRQQPN